MAYDFNPLQVNSEGQSNGCPSSISGQSNTQMEGTMVQRIGNVLYTVRVRSGESAVESFEAKIRDYIEKAVLSDLGNEDEAT